MAFEWKMIFNPDLTKQAHELIFSRKTKKLLPPSLSFNNIPLNNSIFQKNLGLTLDVKLYFVEHIKNITQRISKTMGLLRHPYWLYLKYLSEVSQTMLISSTTKLITPLFMKNSNLFNAMLVWQ